MDFQGSQKSDNFIENLRTYTKLYYEKLFFFKLGAVQERINLVDIERI